MRRVWTIAITSLLLGACAPIGSSTSGSDAANETGGDSPTTPTVDADALHAFVEDHAAELFEPDGLPALVVLVPEEDAERRVLNLDELEGFSIEYVDSLAANGNVQVPPTAVALGLWAMYPDTDTSAWIDQIEVSGDLFAAVETEQTFKPATVPDTWTLVTEIESSSILRATAATSGELVLLFSDKTVVVDRNGTQLDAVNSLSHRNDWPRLYEVAGQIVALRESGVTEVFDLSTTEWSEVDAMPTATTQLGAASVGEELFVVTSTPRSSSTVGVVYSFNIAMGAWVERSTVPEPINVGDVTWFGDRIVVAGSHQDGSNQMIGDTTPAVYVFDPADDSWEPWPDAPISGQSSSVGSAGDTLIAWNYDGRYALSTQLESWGITRRLPLDPMECYARTISGGDAAVLLFCGQLALFVDGALIAAEPIARATYSVDSESIWAVTEASREQWVVYQMPLSDSQTR